MARTATRERRGSGAAQRRSAPRGGRRADDPSGFAPPPNIPCSNCDVGVATIFTISQCERRRTILYRCLFCRQFQKRVEGA